MDSEQRHGQENRLRSGWRLVPRVRLTARRVWIAGAGRVSAIIGQRRRFLRSHGSESGITLSWLYGSLWEETARDQSELCDEHALFGHGFDGRPESFAAGAAVFHAAVRHVLCAPRSRFIDEYGASFDLSKSL